MAKLTPMKSSNQLLMTHQQVEIPFNPCVDQAIARPSSFWQLPSTFQNCPAESFQKCIARRIWTDCFIDTPVNPRTGLFCSSPSVNTFGWIQSTDALALFKRWTSSNTNSQAVWFRNPHRLGREFSSARQQSEHAGPIFFNHVRLRESVQAEPNHRRRIVQLITEKLVHFALVVQPLKVLAIAKQACGRTLV